MPLRSRLFPVTLGIQRQLSRLTGIYARTICENQSHLNLDGGNFICGWPHGNGEIILSVGGMGMGVGIHREDE